MNIHEASWLGVSLSSPLSEFLNQDAAFECGYAFFLRLFEKEVLIVNLVLVDARMLVSAHTI